ncbi:MAG: extracellular solute-binding protein, partial [Streptosporangiales bacterium]|nr:extracellular solute-binding protein [Streptosporangiales bacterium]
MSKSKVISRRSMLGYMGTAGSLAALTPLGMCGTSGSQSSDKLVLATVTEAGQVDSDAYQERRMKKFTEQTGIEVELRTYPIDQYANSIQLLFSQNNPPDVFRSAGTEIAHPVPYVRGWEASLQEYVTDDFMSRWPKNSFEPGISGLHVGDELYATPFGS